MFFIGYRTVAGVKLTVRGEYALRALTYLGRRFGPHVIRIQEISDEESIPKRFLEQILNDLRTGGFVESRRGVAGGYRLAKSPERIPLAAVVRHIEGALAPIGCVSENYYEKCNCPDEARCALRSVMKQVRDAVAGLMEKLTLADLVQRATQLQSEPASAADYFI
jgi:Rrf2 family protein